MFEIRIICDPADTDRVTTALTAAFTTGSIRRHPTRDGDRTRLYLTADHRPTPADWPTAEQAYADAPTITREIGWVARTARTVVANPADSELARTYLLRKAALLDRIALHDDQHHTSTDTTAVAEEAALLLLDLDQPAVICDPRAYVRQQYAHRTADHH
ncbi:hypothetical protein [Streptomyces sp. NPDC017202]|uniref:hypothetical protein n=1 Tax=Streptomyces sp. NPDC017202 TaxID=3364981 RepID=UPI0037883072